jgi:hypothetical protein
MRTRVGIAILCLAAVLFSTSAAAQRGGAGFGRGKTPAPPSKEPFDPHDFNGVWWRTGGTREFNTQKGEEPAFTAAGKARFDANKPGYGPRAVPPAVGNDPLGQCNPDGLPRILMFNRPVEFIQQPKRLIQFFQYHRVLREIWMDGRKLPENPDVPKWYGYSVGRWEDDTLVVDSYGFDDRQWLDNLGYPYSDQMRLQERYRRTDHDHIEMVVVVNDPKYYAKPWRSQTKSWQLLSEPSEYSDPGWDGLIEELCAPIDEVDQFNKRIRNPAAGITER